MRSRGARAQCFDLIAIKDYLQKRQNTDEPVKCPVTCCKQMFSSDNDCKLDLNFVHILKSAPASAEAVDLCNGQVSGSAGARAPASGEVIDLCGDSD